MQSALTSYWHWHNIICGRHSIYAVWSETNLSSSDISIAFPQPEELRFLNQHSNSFPLKIQCFQALSELKPLIYRVSYSRKILWVFDESSNFLTWVQQAWAPPNFHAPSRHLFNLIFLGRFVCWVHIGTKGKDMLLFLLEFFWVLELPMSTFGFQDSQVPGVLQLAGTLSCHWLFLLYLCKYATLASPFPS